MAPVLGYELAHVCSKLRCFWFYNSHRLVSKLKKSQRSRLSFLKHKKTTGDHYLRAAFGLDEIKIKAKLPLGRGAAATYVCRLRI